MVSPKTVITKDLARGGFRRKLWAIQRAMAGEGMSFSEDDDILLNDTVFLEIYDFAYHIY